MTRIGLAWTWRLIHEGRLNRGWTQGYDPDTMIYWFGPVGIVYGLAE